MTDREIVLLERGFVLHQRPYRNTSQLLECLTAAHGRVGLVARGSRRPGSRERALLQPFTPLKLSWNRRGDLGRLTYVEPEGAAHRLEGQALLAGFYVNELVLRLLARGDSNAEVFSCYSRCLAELADGAGAARALRLFELRLLQALGYGLELDRDLGTGEPIVAERRYAFELERGFVASDGPVDPFDDDGDIYSGADLIALRDEALDTATSLRAAQRLLARVLDAYLGERPLKTRAVLRDIVSRGL
ncbi:MAG TPA: DNA repair protein RecO [Gammaproteobacteria bacterium]